MKVKRIMANTATSDLDKADRFYGDILGLERLMDHGWFRTYGSHETMMVQVSFGSEGGSGTPVPDLSIEVDDLEGALSRLMMPVYRLSTARSASPGGCGASTCVIRSASCSISFNTSEPCGVPGNLMSTLFGTKGPLQVRPPAP